MRIEVTEQEREFRAEVRDWLQANVPREHRRAYVRETDVHWQRALYEGGWAGINWPKAFGGRGLSPDQMLIWYEECAKVHAPHWGCMATALMHAGPTLIARGTEDQQTYHLPRILKGEAVWCQGFSEPGAGSDLANIQTRAEVYGEELVVNGSKIWTSSGHLADWQELLVRTDPKASKHKGMSWVICDMRSPGIEVRPIRVMSGPYDTHFCEVFYADVRIPLSNVVGGLNNGWSVAGATLGFERGTGFIPEQLHQAEVLEDLIKVAGERSRREGRVGLDHGEITFRLATLRAEFAAVRALTHQSISRDRNGTPGAEASMIRLYFSEAHQRLTRLAMDVLGARMMKLSNDRGWTYGYLRAFPATIAAGTSDIQRNIIGERILGLPRGPRPS